MDVKQIYDLTNQVTQEVLGNTELVTEDLSNIVELGTTIENARGVDNYVRSLADRIGRVIFVNRPYQGGAPSVLMDGWEYGSILEKIQADIPNAAENETWMLQDGQSYEQDIFYAPKVSAKFFNKRVTFEVDQSITRRQVLSAFSGPEQYNAFLSMLYNAVDKAMTVRTDSLIMRTINNMIGETVYSEFPSAGYNSNSGVRAVNLLHLYNSKFPDATVTAESALMTPAFIRFASMQMGLYMDRLTRLSELFNVGGKARFTPRDRLHIVLLSEFVAAARAYLQSDTFHDALVALPNAETVPYWQGSGLDYSFGSTGEIHINTASGHAVELTGILGVMFDRDALGVTNYDRRVETHYNAKAEFYNNFYKFEAGYFNDLDENFVVFFIA